MGIFAEGGESHYKDGKAPAPTQAPISEYTPGYKDNSAAILAAYDKRKRLGGPAAVVAERAGYIPGSKVGSGYQQDAAMALNAASQGKGPSAAPGIMRQGTDEAIRARLAAVAGAPRGGSGALVQQAAGGLAANVLSQSAGNAAQTKASEVNAATGQYAGLAGAMRGADLQAAQQANAVALNNASMAQAINLQNQRTDMEWSRMSDQEKVALLGMQQTLNTNEAENRTNAYRMMWGLDSERRALSMRDQMARDQQMGQAVAGVGAAAGYVAKAYGASGGSDGWDSYAADLRR